MNEKQKEERFPSIAKGNGIRHVIYHETHGIYLGENLWSRLSSQGKPTQAPTFTREEGLKKIDSMDHSEFDNLNLKIVVPTLANGNASIQDCKNALLPGW